jgi:serine/threonine protein kinase/tetratricopeptide (TPR) repeat protein
MSSDNEKDIFYEALDLEPKDRDVFLDSRCADSAMKERIENLINSHENASEFMSDPTMASHGTAELPTKNPDELAGPIGPYALKRLLGEGGFGRVYLARQERPISRTVALKVLKAGMDTRAIIARFEAERQALAVMDHPNVARVFDGGQTDTGHPYFVMEYVRGESITSFCTKHNLSLRRRLELFEQVCLAVQHAHHKGIIHRDLKPSNVLVTMIDNVPVPKVIDFGIAKALGSESSGQTQMTLQGHLIGTPAYMSPEQVTGTAGMDTRSDVFTLGVLLYELLAGALPFDASRIDKASASALAEIICDETPPKPSTRISTATGDTAQQTRQLSSQLRGDLDWIVMRAMEKDPARRYQTANAFAADIRRYLQDEAVDAGPPSSVYRFKKYAQRHRGEIAAGGLILTALVAGLISSLVFAARVDSQQRLTARELEKSQAFSGFATDMLSGLDPAVARGKDTELLLQILNDAEQGLDESPPEFSEVEASMRKLLGVAYHKVADFDAAEEQFLSAIELDAQSEHQPGQAFLDAARLRHDLGRVYTETTRLEEAKTEFEFVRDVRLQHLGPDNPETLTVMFDLGVVDRLNGNYEQARDTFEHVLARRAAVLGDQHADTMSTRNSLATVLDDLLEYERSAELLRQVVAYQLEELGEDHPHTLATLNNLADTLGHLGKKDEEVQILIDVLETKRRVLGTDHPSLIVALNNLAHTYGEMDKETEAEAMINEALEISSRTLGDKDMRTLVLTNNLASIYLKTNRPELARSILLPAIPIAEEALGEKHPLTLAMISYKVGIHRDSGETSEAVSTAQLLLVRAMEAFPAHHPNQANHRRLLANTLFESGEPDAAKPYLLEALELHNEGVSGSPEDVRNTLEALIKVCDALGQTEESAAYSAERDKLPGS